MMAFVELSPITIPGTAVKVLQSTIAQSYQKCKCGSLSMVSFDVLSTLRIQVTMVKVSQSMMAQCYERSIIIDDII
uniref:Uncharacterized protein n=1 Tax=Romanomermis culicivorax TaxID=13658 RepID=A0A915JUW4_ROMCU